MGLPVVGRGVGAGTSGPPRWTGCGALATVPPRLLGAGPRRGAATPGGLGGWTCPRPATHDLRWRGKPDRQIGSTHWQTWLQADAQRDAIRGLGPAPATRALDAAAPDRTLAPHTVPLANLPFEPAAEGAIRKSVPLPPARGATEPTKCPLCADKYYTSRAMLEHLAWHAVHAAAPADDKEAATNILQGEHGGPHGTPRTPGAPRPRQPTTQMEMRRHPERPRGLAVRPH